MAHNASLTELMIAGRDGVDGGRGAVADGTFSLDWRNRTHDDSMSWVVGL